MNKVLKYGTGLIALYLIVAYGTSAGKVITSGAQSSALVIKSFQAR